MANSKKNAQPQETDEWAVLAKKAQDGDKAAYNSLLQALIPYIKNITSGTLADPDWADDIAQEVLVSVHKALNTYDPRKPFKPWLGAIINFRRTDFLRKHYKARGQQKTSLNDPEYIRDHVTNPAHAGEYKDIEDALSTLSEKQRRVFTMIKIEGYTAREVAKKTGMSVSAVKVSAHRSMKKLKKNLA